MGARVIPAAPSHGNVMKGPFKTFFVLNGPFMTSGRAYWRHLLPLLMHFTSWFISRCDMTFAKSSWSERGLCFS